mmetsp:Transcript_40139/g.114756  ORF Transcript_40139/g.114756 Transcript_40139/m.114756 type:complete len:412 (+) Transcript_40139:90-1325(+)
MLLDSGLVLYLALLALFLWRWLAWWRYRGSRLACLNYCSLLFFVLGCLLVNAIVLFVRAASSGGGKSAWTQLPGWMRPVLLGTPGAACLTVLLSGVQAMQHVAEIRQGRAIVKHDRAVQIVALPAVYGVMAMNSLARMYQLVTTSTRAPNGSEVAMVDEREQLFIAKSETCFWVGDLYEAWALYQFAKLTLELIKASVGKLQSSSDAAERDGANALMVAHGAVESIAWLGVMLFLVVCVLQAGWSLYLLSFTAHVADWAEYNRRMGQFSAAGIVASAGAIYNVHVVESTFHTYFEGYRPLLKFITVKIIVSFAFFQKGIFSVLQAFKATLPGSAQRLANKVPLIGDILNFSEVDFQLFYDSLMLYECILICILHWWGWSASEDWYLTDVESEEGEAGENTALLAASPAGQA